MKSRLILLTVGLVAFFGVLTAKLASLQVVHHEQYLEQAEQQHHREVALNPPRGAFYDAAGRPLAVSVPTDSVYAVPKDIEDPEATAAALIAALGDTTELTAAKLAGRLTGDGWFVWVARQLDPPVARRVRELKLPGIGFKEEAKRYYPQGSLAGQVLGFVGTDSKGLAGLELEYDATVAGRAGHRTVLRDAGGRTAITPGLAWAAAEPGADLHLTLDASLQHIAEGELARAIDQFGAAAGSVILLDPWSGAVRAMASYPAFDPNRFAAYERPELKRRSANKGLSEVFEPGSTFKIVAATAGLEHNLIDPADELDCGMGRIVLRGITIRDHKPFGRLTFRQVMAKSSNVGTIRVGLAVGPERLHRQVVAYGFGERTGIDLPGESRGLLRPLEKWQSIDHAYISFGQGIAVTGIQLASAFAAVANGGSLLQPYLVEAVGSGAERGSLHPEPEVIGRVAGPAVVRQVERLLEAVVEEGTATTAAIDGYRVAGKTGTAQMAAPGGGGYSATDHKAVFAAFVPARRPRLVGVVMIDRPRSNIHGGQVAAPVFGAIARRAMVYLGERPDRPAAPAWQRLAGSSFESAGAEAPRGPAAGAASIAAAPPRVGPAPALSDSSAPGGRR